MKLIDLYDSYKAKYKEYVILIKSGIFYEVYNEDVSIMYSLFNYKIKSIGNNYNIGFPEKNLYKVLDKLNQYKVNYIVVDKINDEFSIVDKDKFSNNNYNKYQIDINRMNYLTYRIDNIYRNLINKINDTNIDNILQEVERLL